MGLPLTIFSAASGASPKSCRALVGLGRRWPRRVSRIPLVGCSGPCGTRMLLAAPAPVSGPLVPVYNAVAILVLLSSYGGLNDKRVRSNSAVEERASAPGGSTTPRKRCHYCVRKGLPARCRSQGRCRWQEEDDVCGSTPEDQPGAEGAMGKAEGKTEADDLSGGTQEDRGGAEGTVGEEDCSNYVNDGNPNHEPNKHDHCFGSLITARNVYYACAYFKAGHT
jgi:hypothetical protein